MPTKTYFVLMRGTKSSLLPIVVGTQSVVVHKLSQVKVLRLILCMCHADVLPGSKVLWAGTGDWVVDAPWVLQPRTGQVPSAPFTL